MSAPKLFARARRTVRSWKKSMGCSVVVIVSIVVVAMESVRLKPLELLVVARRVSLSEGSALAEDSKVLSQ